MATNEQNAIKSAEAISALLKTFAPNPYANIGPSAEFLNTHLAGSVVQPDDLNVIIGNIDKAIHDGNMQVINEVLGTVKGLIGPLGAMFGI